jgi:hypothetical protein
MAKKRKRRPRAQERLTTPAGAARGHDVAEHGGSEAPAARNRDATPRRPGAVQAAAGQADKQARKQEARDQRERIRKQATRRRNTRRGAIVVAALALAAAIAFLLFRPAPTSTPKVAPGGLTGLNTGPPPWPAETDGLYQRLLKIGLQPLPLEGTGLHSDQHLDIYVDGQPVTIPAQIGIPPGYKADPGVTPTDFISILHTHDSSGTVHVESPTRTQYTLGEFFDVWGVRFTPTCLGGLCETKDKKIEVFVNGKLQTGDPTKVLFSLQPFSQEIVLTYGTKAELPNPIPSRIPGT